jgi:hypothetical protein
MQKKVLVKGIGAGVLAAGLLIAPAVLAPPSLTAAQAACEPGDRVDNTTAQQAQKRAQTAGYTNVKMDRKGCDNVWHGVGMKGGASVRIAVSPSGEVNQEGD